MIVLPGFRTERESLGPFIVHNCPNCKVEGKQFLVVELTSPTLFGLPIWLPVTSHLSVCPECKHEIVLTRGDSIKANQLLHAVNSGEIDNAEALHERIAELDFEFKRQQQLVEETWTCECSEEVPIGFQVCWKCGYEHPDPDSLPPPEEVKKKQPLYDPFGGGFGIVDEELSEEESEQDDQNGGHGEI